MNNLDEGIMNLNLILAEISNSLKDIAKSLTALNENYCATQGA